MSQCHYVMQCHNSHEPKVEIIHCTQVVHFTQGYSLANSTQASKARAKNVKPKELNQDDLGFYAGDNEDGDNLEKKRSAPEDLTCTTKRYKTSLLQLLSSIATTSTPSSEPEELTLINPALLWARPGQKTGIFVGSNSFACQVAESAVPPNSLATLSPHKP
ncbi:hypothetical protein BDR03DRAFT_983994 [Suillus americanus]|nr:hypothetical protein BDR03DRAFT_983994 [Suillus americanus]